MKMRYQILIAFLLMLVCFLSGCSSDVLLIGSSGNATINNITNNITNNFTTDLRAYNNATTDWLNDSYYWFPISNMSNYSTTAQDYLNDSLSWCSLTNNNILTGSNFFKGNTYFDNNSTFFNVTNNVWWSSDAWNLTGNFSARINASSILGGTLPVARGGTGVTTSTGSTNVVLSTSPTITGTMVTSNITMGGFLKLSNVTLMNITCDSGTEGYGSYNYTAHRFTYCNSTNWVLI